MESKQCCTEHYQNDAKQSRICATRSGTISKHDTDRSSQFPLWIKTSRGEFRARGGRETSGSNRPMEHGLVNKDAETRPRNKFTTD